MLVLPVMQSEKLTFPVCLFWGEDFQDVDAATAMRGFENDGWVNAELLSDTV